MDPNQNNLPSNENKSQPDLSEFLPDPAAVVQPPKKRNKTMIVILSATGILAIITILVVLLVPPKEDNLSVSDSSTIDLSATQQDIQDKELENSESGVNFLVPDGWYNSTGDEEMLYGNILIKPLSEDKKQTIFIGDFNKSPLKDVPDSLQEATKELGLAFGRYVQVEGQEIQTELQQDLKVIDGVGSSYSFRVTRVEDKGYFEIISIIIEKNGERQWILAIGNRDNPLDKQAVLEIAASLNF